MANEDLAAELNTWRENNPHALHSCAVVPIGMSDLNQLYFKAEEAVQGMFAQLIETGLWPNLPGDMVTNFMGYGFPRAIPNITALDALLIKLERNPAASGLLRVELVFVFKGDSRILYTTSFIA